LSPSIRACGRTSRAGRLSQVGRAPLYPESGDDDDSRT